MTSLVEALALAARETALYAVAAPDRLEGNRLRALSDTLAAEVRIQKQK